MLRGCVWSRFGQLSTFQKDLSPAAWKKRSEERSWCLWSGQAAHSVLLVVVDDIAVVVVVVSIRNNFMKTEHLKEKQGGGDCAYGWCFGGGG